MSWYLRKRLPPQTMAPVHDGMMDGGVLAPPGAVAHAVTPAAIPPPSAVTAPALSRTQGSYRTCCGPHIRRYISDMEERKRT